jgi:hypothetical protein
LFNGPQLFKKKNRISSRVAGSINLNMANSTKEGVKEEPAPRKSIDGISTSKNIKYDQ